MDNCLFCRIVSGELPSTRIYEDDAVIAFADLHPVAPVHVLIVPRRHFDDLNTMAVDPDGPAALTAVLKAAPKVASLMGVRESGYRLINNCGEDAGQTIRHVHFHLIGGVRMGARLL